MERRKVLRRLLAALWLVGLMVAGYFIGRRGAGAIDRHATPRAEFEPRSGVRGPVANVGRVRRSAEKNVEVAGGQSVGSAVAGPFLFDLDRARTTRGGLEFRVALLDLSRDQVADIWTRLAGSADFDDSVDFDIVVATLGRLAELDADAAMAAVDQTGAAKYRVVASVVSGWARADFDGALSWVRSNADPRMRDGAFITVLDVLAGQSREAALDLWQRVVEDGDLHATAWNLGDIFTRWARESPDEALERALEISGTSGNRSALDGALRHLGRTSPLDGVDWIRSEFEGEEREELLGRFIESWGVSDPSAAVQFIRNSAHGATRAQRLVEVLAKWADVDFEAANEQIDRIEEEGGEGSRELADRARSALVRRGAHSIDSDAFRLALEHIDRPGMFEAVEAHARRLALEDPKRAMEWAREELTDPRQHDAFVSSLLRSWAGAVPAEAAEQLADMDLVDGSGRLYRDLTSIWAERDSGAARAWVDELPRGEERDLAVEGLVEGWLQRDRHEASQFIARLPAGPRRDQFSRREAARQMNGYRDIERSVAAARRIAHPFLREQTFESIFKTWLLDRIKASKAHPYILASPDISEAVRWRVIHRTRERTWH